MQKYLALAKKWNLEKDLHDAIATNEKGMGNSDLYRVIQAIEDSEKYGKTIKPYYLKMPSTYLW